MVIFNNASFNYDGDGKRVKSVETTSVGTTTTYFVGGHYELTGAESTKYYFAGSTRIAMRKGNTLYYLLGDHLGSTSIVTDASGNKVSEMRYKAWGEVRYNWGVTPTDYGFTGQYSHQSDFGLMFYNSRYYDSYLNHFTQPDSIVPDPYNSQDYDRYSYARNNPLRYVDPSGHTPVCIMGGANGSCLTWAGLAEAGNNDAAGFEGLNNDIQARIAGKMMDLGIYKDEQKAMNYVTSSECMSGACTSSGETFKAMMHKYNEHCSGGAWSPECIQSFWGYPQGILTGDPRSFPVTPTTENMAAAILDQTGASHGGFANDGHGCGQYDNGIMPYCDWANFTDNPGSQDLVSTLHDKYTPTCVLTTDCSFVSEFGATSFWIHYQGGDKFFVVMDRRTKDIYCNPPYNYCEH